MFSINSKVTGKKIPPITTTMVFCHNRNKCLSSRVTTTDKTESNSTTTIRAKILICQKVTELSKLKQTMLNQHLPK